MEKSPQRLGKFDSISCATPPTNKAKTKLGPTWLPHSPHFLPRTDSLPPVQDILNKYQSYYNIPLEIVPYCKTMGEFQTLRIADLLRRICRNILVHLSGDVFALSWYMYTYDEELLQRIQRDKYRDIQYLGKERETTKESLNRALSLLELITKAKNVCTLLSAVFEERNIERLQTNIHFIMHGVTIARHANVYGALIYKILSLMEICFDMHTRRWTNECVNTPNYPYWNCIGELYDIFYTSFDIVSRVFPFCQGDFNPSSEEGLFHFRWKMSQWIRMNAEFETVEPL